jgi:hypothetical protein
VLLKVFQSGHYGGTGEKIFDEVAMKYAWIAHRIGA